MAATDITTESTTIAMARMGQWFSARLVHGWLFTLGFLHLTFWKGALAIILWPYYLGQWVQALHVRNLTTLVH